MRHLYLNFRNEFFRLEIAKIVYFEADGNYTALVLASKQKAVLTMNLARTQQLLSENLGETARTFARVGKRFIINLKYVTHIDVTRLRLTLSDCERFAYQLPISKEALRALKDMIVAGARQAKAGEKE